MEPAGIDAAKRSARTTVIESSRQIAGPSPAIPASTPSDPGRSRDEQPTSAFPCSDDPAGPLSRGIRRRGAGGPRGQPAGHERRRYRRRRDDDSAAPAVDELAPAEVRPADAVLPAPHPEAEPHAK